jgi:hypothetical protein
MKLLDLAAAEKIAAAVVEAAAAMAVEAIR